MRPTAPTLAAGCCLAVALLLTACTGAARRTDSPASPGSPSLRVTVVATGLDHPWDVAQAPTAPC